MAKKKSTYIKIPKKDKLPNSRTPEVMEEHKGIILEYFTNGFNAVAAVQLFRPMLSNNIAGSTFQAIKNSKHNKEYIQELQARLESMTDVKAEHILKELIQWSYSDVSSFIGLSVEDIKALPPDVRRTIQSYEVTDHTDKYGNSTGQTVKLRLVNKLDSMKEISKMKGMYSIDNDQKATKIQTINFLKANDPETLNKLLATIEANTIELD